MRVIALWLLVYVLKINGQVECPLDSTPPRRNCADTGAPDPCGSCTSKIQTTEVQYSSFIGMYDFLETNQTCVLAPVWMCPNGEECCTVKGEMNRLCAQEDPDYLSVEKVNDFRAGIPFQSAEGFGIGSGLELTVGIGSGHGFEVRFVTSANDELELLFNIMDQELHAIVLGVPTVVGKFNAHYEEALEIGISVEKTQLVM